MLSRIVYKLDSSWVGWGFKIRFCFVVVDVDTLYIYHFDMML